MSKMFSTNSRGFNLFSALVAAVLLAAGVMLTSTLVTTEEKTSFELYKTLSNYQLGDAANLVRADALQSFNYAFRKRLESYLAKSKDQISMSGTGFPILNVNELDFSSSTWSESDWKQAVANFKFAVLKTGTSGDNFDKVLEFVSRNTLTNFEIHEKGAYGKYTVSLSMQNQTDAIAATTKALKEASNSPEALENLFELVDCSEAGCETGTFYFNIPMNAISDESYEALPRIIVKDITTQDEMKIALLPRTNIKIYIPVRFFKAIFEARKNAKMMNDAHSDITKAKLGYCDEGCTPRSNPTSGTSGAWTKSCDGEQDLSPAPSIMITPHYAASGSQVGHNALTAYGIDWICKRTVDTDTGDTKFVNYNTGGTGLLDGPEPTLLPTGTTVPSGCPFELFAFELSGEETKVVALTSAASKLNCSFFTGLTAYAVFKETNTDYIVSGTEKYFKIGIKDTYTKSVSAGTATCTNGTAPASCT